ncbi:glycosyltransferase family 8 protein [Actinosynnema sp. NPDC059335]|uniref:glycosyltransferase family 8 protein n=1 Tax=Actinosynnema sp. NPDC059335 TaxID=3346804 RepID=UPI00366BA8E5
MDIAFTFDSAYGRHAHAAIESVLDHHRSPDVALWLLVAPDVTAEMRDRVTSQVGDRARVTILDPDVRLDDLPVSTVDEFGYVSRATYLRLLLPRLLPWHVERLLYLDCDILCAGSLRELFDLDLRGNVLGAVRDAHAGRLSDMGGLPGLAGYPDLDPDAPYFNAGVLLIDLPAWRDRAVTERCFEYVRRHAAEARFTDQDALNRTLHGSWLRLPKTWNHMLAEIDPSTADGIERARLVHSIGPVKLWDDDCPDNERKARYDEYRRKAEDAIASRV